MWAWLTPRFTNPILARLRRIIITQEVLMGNLDELKTALTNLSATVDVERAEVSAKVQALTDQIRALQEQLAGGGTVTSAQFDELIAMAAGINQGVQSISDPAA